MVYRGIFRAFAIDGKMSELKEKIVSNKAIIEDTLTRNKMFSISFFHFYNEVYLYFDGEILIVPEVDFGFLNTLLATIPGGRTSKWREMPDIYHGIKAESKEQWKREHTNKQGFLQINQVQRQKASEYIFYHYQMQEEMPGFKGKADKYWYIGYDDRFITMYSERPEEKPISLPKGSLDTNNTPFDIWDDKMGTLFEKWEDSNDAWRNTTTVLSIIL
jgi:hypothetical protein